MEKMPYRPELDGQHDVRFQQPLVRASLDRAISSDWRDSLPVLAGSTVTLRQLRASDAASLFALLTTEEVARFISPPPTTVEGFERFIDWTLRQRAGGTFACFAVTVTGFDTAIGIFQVRQMDAAFATAESSSFMTVSAGPRSQKRRISRASATSLPVSAGGLLQRTQRVGRLPGSVLSGATMSPRLW